MFSKAKANYQSDIVLGKTYVDKQTGIEGVAKAIHFYQHGCARVSLEAVVDGEIVEYTFDAADRLYSTTRTGDSEKYYDSTRPPGTRRGGLRVIETTLLVGGPMDGNLRFVQDASQVIYAAEEASCTNPGHPDPSDVVEIRRSAYRPETFSLWGTPLLIHVHESLTPDSQALRSALTRHILSDKGKAIVR